MVYRAFTNGLFDRRYPTQLYLYARQLDTSVLDRRDAISSICAINSTRYSTHADTPTHLQDAGHPDPTRYPTPSSPTHLSAQHPDPTRYPTRGPDSPQRATPRPCSIPDAILDRNSIPRSRLSNLRSPHLLRSQLSPSPDRQTIPHSMVSRMHSNQKARVLSALCSATTPIPTLPERFKFESSSSCRRRCGVDHEAQRELQLPKSNRAPPRSGVPTGGQAAEKPDHRPSCAQIGVAMAP